MSEGGKPDLKVVEFPYQVTVNDSVAMLRKLADEMEEGEYNVPAVVAVVVAEDKLHVFGYGPDATHQATHLVLCAGAQQLLNTFLRKLDSE